MRQLYFPFPAEPSELGSTGVIIGVVAPSSMANSPMEEDCEFAPSFFSLNSMQSNALNRRQNPSTVCTVAK